MTFLHKRIITELHYNNTKLLKLSKTSTNSFLSIMMVLKTITPQSALYHGVKHHYSCYNLCPCVLVATTCVLVATTCVLVATTCVLVATTCILVWVKPGNVRRALNLKTYLE